jgi:hypothetical protein
MVFVKAAYVRNRLKTASLILCMAQFAGLESLSNWRNEFSRIEVIQTSPWPKVRLSNSTCCISP